ncbi:DUF6261 family protein [Sunxiuqinia dokdonensis]|uniref:Uncharacterized protein n=1 Tax=Sunxiuqinia dokdonensis TaxID=1409788 RepID=A0A0L8VA87_9BACT|nr:DUF6261 family protein [Sunxiuqinia dokdonensis]KOH45258.1 hypothetical protein NC99_19500 [Sunxiuqinia dokdonensis]
MIEKVITTSRTTEVNDLASRAVGAFKNTELSGDAYLTGIITGLEGEVARLTAAIKRMKIESQLEEKDEFRDDTLRALFYLVLGLSLHPNAEIKAAATKVIAVLNRYGMSILNESYAIESSLVNSMLGDLSRADLQDVIAVCPGCPELIAATQTAQDDFEATRIAYEEEQGQETTQENATAIKKQMVTLINQKLVLHLRAMEQVQPDAYGPYARTVAQIIADNNEIVKRRRSKAA